MKIIALMGTIMTMGALSLSILHALMIDSDKFQKSVTVFSFNTFLTESYHIGTSPLICSANQWTGIYMIGISVYILIVINFSF